MKCISELIKVIILCTVPMRVSAVYTNVFLKY